MFIQTLSSYKRKAKIWHVAIVDQGGNPHPLCLNSTGGNEFVSMQQYPPAHRLCQRCESIDRERALINILRVRYNITSGRIIASDMSPGELLQTMHKIINA